MAGRLRRGVVIAGTLAVTTGLLTAGSALAGVGTQPGDLELLSSGTVITSGALSSTPTWATTTACPAGFQGSAALFEFMAPGGAELSQISPTVESGLTTPFSGSLDSDVDVGELLALGPSPISATSPGTVEWVVGCYTGQPGIGLGQYVVNAQSIFISVAAGATTFTVSSTGPTVTSPVTTTTLTTTPASPTTTGTPVLLSASVTAADGSAPAGTVQFADDGTDIGTPVEVNFSGTAAPATAYDTFSTAGLEDLSAVFTPTSTSYASSTGSYGLVVEPAGSVPAIGAPVSITATVTPTGALSVTVVNTAVALTENSSGTQATGTLGLVTVTDSRNTYPGWSVSGQEANFTGSGAAADSPISGNQLGWTPTVSGSLVDGAVLGPAVTPAAPGLGSAPGTLAYAAAGCGYGTNVLSANLTLAIPTGQAAGAYTGSLTITYIETQPSGVAGCVPVVVTI
jgi:hypothetical protein